jgi:hypothetical protein
MLFKEIIPVFSAHHKKPKNTIFGQNIEPLIIKAGGTYGHHSYLKA